MKVLQDILANFIFQGILAVIGAGGVGWFFDALAGWIGISVPPGVFGYGIFVLVVVVWLVSRLTCQATIPSVVRGELKRIHNEKVLQWADDYMRMYSLKMSPSPSSSPFDEMFPFIGPKNEGEEK